MISQYYILIYLKLSNVSNSINIDEDCFAAYCYFWMNLFKSDQCVQESMTVPRRYFFCGSFMFLFCLVFAMFCARLFICALWSPAGKGLTSWLSFVVSSVSLSLSHWYPGSGVVLDCIDS